MNLKIFTEDIEPKARNQVYEIAKIPVFKDQQIRIMPDVHWGDDVCIGFTATYSDKIIPNIVGTDIGCLDKETEYLTPNGWKYINLYNNGDKVLQYDPNNDSTTFVNPLRYINEPCDFFYHLHGHNGLDQMISSEHKMLTWIDCKSRGYKLKNYLAEDFVKHNNRLKKGIQGGIKTTFHSANKPLPISDEDIRIMIMISADGTIRRSGKVELHISKPRKINRAIQLLKNGKIPFKLTNGLDGTTFIYFSGKDFYTKDLSMFFKASEHQLKIITEECMLWDGTIKVNSHKKMFSTSSKINADVIQYAFAVSGIRCGMHTVHYDDKPSWKPTHMVYTTLNEIVGFPATKLNGNIPKVSSIDGRKYCFTVPSGYFIIRRNGKISITGNCGMLAINLGQIQLDLPKIDAVINEFVPNGRHLHDEAVVSMPELNTLRCKKMIKEISMYEKAIGTLGGGNHFIEISKNENDETYLIIHTGSRNLGNGVATYYQDLAFSSLMGKEKLKQEKQALIQAYKKAGNDRLIADALKAQASDFYKNHEGLSKQYCYVTDQLMADYIHDAVICQQFATLNRKTIAEIIIKQTFGDQIKRSQFEQFETIHNYIDVDAKIIRKGAISAKKDERMLIPINMADGSLIVTGKGNPDWNYSAPHGAGRVLGRRAAKDALNMDDYKEAMKHVYSTSVCEATIDEAPMAYKSIDSIINTIGDTATIKHHLKPIYNFKSSQTEDSLAAYLAKKEISDG